jgi:hypothetical protein
MIGWITLLADSIVNARLSGESVTSLRSRTPLAEVLLEHEHELDRRRRALVGDAADAHEDVSAPEPSKLLAQALRVVQRIEAVCPVDEPRDPIVHQSCTGRDDQVVPIDAAALKLDGSGIRVDPDRRRHHHVTAAARFEPANARWPA